MVRGVIILCWIGIFGLLPSSSTGLRLMLISEEMEIEIGKQVAKQAESEYGGVIFNHPRGKVFGEIGEKLAKQSVRKKIPYSFKVLAEAKILNAFACPGGPIYITQALLNKLDNEAELAFVLGHEIAHIDQQHSRKAINKALIVQLGGAIIFKGSSEDIKLAAGIGWNLLNRGYSRSDEKESDMIGVRFVAKGGYHPRGAIQALEKIGGERYRGLAKYLVTHPSTPDRIAAIRRQIEKEFSGEIFAQARPLPEAKVIEVAKKPIPAPEDRLPSYIITQEQAYRSWEGRGEAIRIGGNFSGQVRKGISLRIALVGFPKGDSERELTEITSRELSGYNSFLLCLPYKPEGFLPSPTYNGAFHLRIYPDFNKNNYRDQGEPWISKADFILVYGQRSSRANILLGWNLVILEDTKIKRIFSGKQLLSYRVILHPAL